MATLTGVNMFSASFKIVKHFRMFVLKRRFDMNNEVIFIQTIWSGRQQVIIVFDFSRTSFNSLSCYFFYFPVSPSFSFKIYFNNIVFLQFFSIVFEFPACLFWVVKKCHDNYYHGILWQFVVDYIESIFFVGQKILIMNSQ